MGTQACTCTQIYITSFSCQLSLTHRSRNMNNSLKRGLWSPEEDEKLINYISIHGLHGSWSVVPKFAGLQRSGKSCRLRWINYLRPGLRQGNFSDEEAMLIINLHNKFGNKWAEIAKHLPGRTDSSIKNFCNSNMKKKKKQLLAANPKNKEIQNLNFDLMIAGQYWNPDNTMIQFQPSEMDLMIHSVTDLPPLPPSLVLHLHPPENFDFIIGQNSDPNHLIMQFESSEMNGMDLIMNQCEIK
ncbi:putative transcription factor MYB-HB-like family [Helianthus debilis subsp. tardiflorus]